MLLDRQTDFSPTCDRAEQWRAVETCLAGVMAAFRVSDPERDHRSAACTASTIFDILTDRDYCYLSKSKAARYRPQALASIDSALGRGEPIEFSYDLGAGYHASIQPGISDLRFDVGLGELFVLRQIATFVRRVRSVYPPGARFHVVIDNLCGMLVNDIPVTDTEAYCACFRELLDLTAMDAMVTLIVESEHFSVGDFRGLPEPASDGPAVDAKARDNVARFLGRPCSESEASARLLRYRDVIAESERLLNQVIRGVHMTQRATPDTMCFRPFPGADCRIQCGEVALGRNVNGRICPFLLTSQNAGAYWCQRARFPGLLPHVIGEITYAERLTANRSDEEASAGALLEEAR